MAHKARIIFRPIFCQFVIVCPLYTIYSINKVKTTIPLHVLQSVMTECQCVYVVVQDPSLVVCASHKGLGLLLRADIESLVVDTLEAAFDH